MTTPPLAVQAVGQTIVEDSAQGLANATNRVLGGIIAYVRWPAGRGARTMCVVGTPQLTAATAPDMPGNMGSMPVRRSSAAAVMAGQDCDTLYLGRMPAADRRKLIEWVRSKAILTIADDDPDCLYGAMFCLTRRSGGISFLVNLDSIGRGTIRVDPRVLKMGQSSGGRP